MRVEPVNLPMHGAAAAPCSGVQPRSLPLPGRPVLLVPRLLGNQSQRVKFRVHDSVSLPARLREGEVE